MFSIATVIRDRFAGVVLVLLGVFWVGRLALTGQVMVAGDWPALIHPFYEYSRTVWRDHGRLPMWNPFLYLGMPHLVSLNSLALYPTELGALLAGIPSGVFYVLDGTLHLVVAGLGVAWLVRREGGSNHAGLVGGVAYGFGSFALTHLYGGHPHWVRAMAAMPWVLGLVDRSLERRSVRDAALAGLVLGLVALTAAMQFLAYALLVICGWALWGPVIEARTRPTWTRRVLTVGLVAVVAGGAGAVLLLPGGEHYLNSVRIHPSPDWTTRWGLRLIEVPLLAVPGLWGAGAGYFGPHEFSVTTIHVGWIILLLAGLRMVTPRSSDIRWIALALVSVVLAFGPATPVGGALEHVPLFGGFRGSARWMTFFVLAAAVLGGLGFDRIESAGAAGGRRAVLGLGLLAGVACLVAAEFPGRLLQLVPEAMRQYRLGLGHLTGEGMAVAMRSALHIGGALGVAAAVVVGLIGGGRIPGWLRVAVTCSFLTMESWFGSRGLLETGGWTSITRLQGVSDSAARHLGGIGGRVFSDGFALRPDRHMFHGIRLITAYHGLPLIRPTILMTVADAGGPGQLPALETMQVDAALMQGRLPAGMREVRGAEGRTADAGRLGLATPGHPRAWFARTVAWAGDLDTVYLTLQQPGWTPEGVLLDHPVPASLRGLQFAARGRIDVSDLQDEVRISVEAAGPAVIVVSEAWYPAWKAFVDGARVPILRAFGAVMAVPAATGARQIRLVFDSILFKLGIWLSVLCLGTAVATGIWGFRGGTGIPPSRSNAGSLPDGR